MNARCQRISQSKPILRVQTVPSSLFPLSMPSPQLIRCPEAPTAASPKCPPAPTLSSVLSPPLCWQIVHAQRAAERRNSKDGVVGHSRHHQQQHLHQRLSKKGLYPYPVCETVRCYICT